MSTRPSGQIDQRINSLAELELSGQTLDDILGHVGRLGVASLAGWDAAATSLAEKDRIATYGANDPRIDPVDQNQYDNNAGPCVDAAKAGEIQYFDGTDFKPEWRQFAEAAAQADVYSVLSFPLKLRDEVIGAINFYSGERDALRPGQREEGSVFAAHAAVAIANAKELGSKEALVGQLEEGLQTRTVIGQATGLLMAQEGLTSEEAFQKLVKVSQTSNVKLREIAQRYVESWEGKAQQNQR
jgi:hypothetical protein